MEASVYYRDAWKTLRTYEYDPNGNKTKETDSNGNSTRFAYDSKNRLIKKTYYEGDNVKKAEQVLSYTNVSDGDSVLLLAVTDEEGYTQRFYYNAYGNLVKSELTPDNKVYYVSTFNYDCVGNKIRQVDARGNASTFKYDGLGRLLAKTDELGYSTYYTYNGMNKLLTMEEPGGRVTEYVYDELGRVKVEKIYKKGTADFVFTRYEYDGADNIISVKKGSMANGKETILVETGFTYNIMNRVTDEYRRIDDTSAAHIKYDYDSNGRKTSVIEYANPEKSKYRSYKYEYDFAGRLISEKGAYTVNGIAGGAYGSYFREFEYDYEGNLLKQVIYNGNDSLVITYEYDYRNLPVTKTEPFTSQSSRITKYAYDRKGNLLSETIIRQGKESTVSYIYDGLGRVTAQVSPTGGITTYIYDEMNNLVKQILPAYNGMPADKAPGMEYEYDAMNRQCKVVAFDGQRREVVSYREYDTRGNVIKEADGAGYNPANPKASVGAIYEYDIHNNAVLYISAQTAADNKRNGTNYHTIKKEYDGLGRVISEEDAYGHKTLYSYYMNGKIKEKVYPDGSRESFAYDLTGKIEEIRTDKASNITRIYNNIFDKPYRIVYPDNTCETFNYSQSGYLSESTDRAGNPSYYEYTPAGDLAAKKEFVRTDASYDWFRLTARTYDESGNVLSSETFEYGRPRQGGLTEVFVSAGDRTEYIYDKAGRLIKTSGPAGRETLYEYDINGNPVKQMQKVTGNVYEIRKYAYDFRQRMVSEAVLVRSDDILAEYISGAVPDSEYDGMLACVTGFEYYSSGKLRSRKDAAGRSTVYEYDYDGRVVKKTDPMQNTTVYTWDMSGNLVQEKNARGFAVSYDYDSMNRLIRKTSPAADGSNATIRYIYDVTGNLVKQIRPNDYVETLDTPELVNTMPGISCTYDCMNRCTAILSPEGRILEAFSYDAKGNIVKKVDGLRYTGSTESSPGTTYTYDGLDRVTTVTDALNNVTSFEYDITGNVVKQTDARKNTTIFEYNGDGTLARTIYADGSRMEYTYDGLGRITSSKDQNGNITSYSYNGFGKLRSETDPYGYSTEYRYDLNGNQVSIKDKRGSVTLLKYDALNRLTEKRMPISADGSGSTVWSIERYLYNSAGNLVKKTLTGTKDKLDTRETTYTYYLNNQLKTVSDSSGAETTNYYDKNGNLVKTVTLRDSGQYDIQKFEYDSMDRLTKSIMLADEEDIFNTSGITNIDALRDDEYAGKIRLITEYEYDLLGNKTKEIRPGAFAYAESDTENRENYTVRYTYDALNRLESIRWRHNGEEVYARYTYDGNGNRTKTRDERGYETTYEYDSMNRLVSFTDPMGGVWSYTYDPAGNRLSQTNPRGDTISYTYDKLNRLETVTDPYGVVVTTNIYDPNGNIKAIKDSKGNATIYTYDLSNRLITMTDPEAADSGAITETYEYNQYGERVSVTDALGNRTTYEYDKAGRLTKVTDAMGVSTRYGYDKAGNKLYMTDGRGKTTSYTYGAFGKLRMMTDAEDRSIIYSYDLSGNLACMIDRNGNITVYTYDSQDRLTEKICAGTGDRISYRYDAAGNRTGMTDSSGESTYTYDGNNRMTRVEKNGVPQLLYSYDAAGNITSVTDNRGNTTTYTWDKANRMETVSFGGKTVRYTYDTNGNRESITYDGGIKEEYTFDKNNRLLTLTNRSADGSEISRYSYTYDLAGREITKTDSYGTSTYSYDGAGRVIKAEMPGKTSIYAYDKAGNRVSMIETYASAQSSGFVDESGTAVEYTLKESQYVYSACNRLVMLVEEMYDGDVKVLTRTVQYTYDANGNQLTEYASFTHPNNSNYRRTISASVYGDMQQSAPDLLIDRTVNTYDGFNRLVRTEKVEAGIRTVAEYVYDGDDLRTKKTVRKSDNGYVPDVTYFLYDRQHVILETDGNNGVKARYIRGVNYIAQYSGTSLMYYLYNGHGDVVQTVTASGEVQNNYDYDIFGNPVLTIETVSCSIRYAGEYLDKETGLYYLRARYYDPNIGRFITEDSYWGEDTNPLSLNLYTYAYNNPIRYIDPTGHMAIEEMIEQARKNAQIKYYISEIEKQKQIWYDEERGAGKDKKEWTVAQVEANRRAEELRQRLLELETGNDKLQQLIRDDSKAIAGALEGYKYEATRRMAEANPSIDYSDVMKQQLQDFALAVTYGRNAIGISASDVSEAIRTVVERFAESVVVSYRAERAYNLMRMSDISYAFGERIVTIKDEIIPLAYAIDSGVAPGRLNAADELLNELLGLIGRYTEAKQHWLGFLGFKSREQKDIHEEANRIRDKIKKTHEYLSDPVFRALVDTTFSDSAYRIGNTKEEVQELLDYLENAKKQKTVPIPEPEPKPKTTDVTGEEGTGNLDNLFNLSVTANEFGDTSDTYKIIYDLMNLYSSSEDSLQKEKYHSLAVDALQKAREGTPYMYGNDIVMETLHTNLAEMIGVQVVNRELYNPIEAYVATFTYLTAKHFKIGDEVNWDYKWDPNWQVPYDYFNGSDMNKVEPSDGSSPKNYVEWIYFKGRVIGADKVANLNWGYIGTKLGYTTPRSLLFNPLTEPAGDGEYIQMGVDMANYGDDFMEWTYYKEKQK